MRIEFIETSSRKQAVAEMSWAAKIIKVEGGYMCFESIQDYLTHKNQK